MEEDIYYKDFVKNNLGKRVLFEDDSSAHKGEGMIVGYYYDDKKSTDDLLIIISFTNEREGWEYIGDEEVILAHSPLNRSFWYIAIRHIIEFID